MISIIGKIYQISKNKAWIHSIFVFLFFLCVYTILFSLTIFDQRLLSFGDGIGYYLPAYYSIKSLWTDLIFGGYPLAADPQNMTWYPPALLLSWIPGSWNLFILLAYTLAGSFSYYYIYTLTASRLAGVVAGISYSMSGFMMAHLSMTTMIHAAAWIPLLLCSFEKLRHSVRRRWLLMSVTAFVCCFLSGNPQVTVYGFGLGIFYSLFLGWYAPIGRWKYYRYIFLLIVVSLGICAIQLFPATELSRLSVRSEMTQEAFFAGSLPPWQSLQYIFPFLFGSDVVFGNGVIASPPYDIPYWGGEANSMDIATYVGILPVILASIGIVGNRSSGIAKFWLGVSIVTFLIIFGKYFFPAKLMYFVPVYNAFRIPARHSIELSLSISVLSGFGILSIQQRQISNKIIRKILITFLLIILLAIVGIVISQQEFQTRLRLIGMNELTFWPWTNPAIGIPLIIFGCSVVAIFVWFRYPSSILTSLIVLTALILDMASYGFWFHNWSSNNVMHRLDVLKLPPFYQRYQPTIHSGHHRLLVEDGVFNCNRLGVQQNLIFPNINRLWNISLSNGYSPLMLSRISTFFHMETTGVYQRQAIADQDRSFDLMSTKYLSTQHLLMTQESNADLYAVLENSISKAIFTPKSILDLILGEDNAELNRKIYKSILIEMPETSHSTNRIAFETSLSNSVSIPNHSIVMDLQVIDMNGNVENHPILAGRDTAEQAFDCPDVQPLMQHQRAEVYESTKVSRNAGSCESHSYKTMISLDKPQKIKSIQLKVMVSSAQILIRRISLVNSERGLAVPIQALQPVIKMTKWKEIERSGPGAMYENKNVLPRTWVVSEVLQLKPEEILQTIHTSRLPNGTSYQPENMALVEVGDNSFNIRKMLSSNMATGKAEILKSTETTVEVKTDSAADAFLILSDVNYPGWQAWVDGKPTKIFQTNYVQRGVMIPDGQHIVRFEFHSLSFQLGAGITVASVFVGLYGLARVKSVM